MKKKEPGIQIAAVIDIGSNSIRLKIGQKIKERMKVLETVDYPLSLGRDTFNTGKISFDKADKACEVIKNYIQIASEYGCEKIRVVATTSVREAENKDYILDQVRLKTGLKVEVIDNLEEKYYIFKLMLDKLSKEIKKSAMMVYIGSGNIGISFVENEHIPYIQNIKVGSLRLSELFENTADYTGQLYLIVEEYLDTFTDILESLPVLSPKYYVASGLEIALIAELCKAEERNHFYYISKDSFDQLYDDIKTKTIERLMDDYRLTGEQSELLMPAMCIFRNLWKYINVEMIVAPMLLPIDSILYEMLFASDFAQLSKNFHINTILSSWEFAKRFGCMETHSMIVEKFALKIFDRLKKLHGLSAKEMLLLQSAAILHDCGKLINVKNHYKHSYNIIRGLDIVGLNVRDIGTVSCVSLYHSRIVPTAYDKIYTDLNQTDRVIVSKLSAILRLADALDRSHEQKFNDIEVKLDEQELTITINSDKNTDLEQWSFAEKGVFFEEVFGIKATLKKKRVNL